MSPNDEKTHSHRILHAFHIFSWILASYSCWLRSTLLFCPLGQCAVPQMLHPGLTSLEAHPIFSSGIKFSASYASGPSPLFYQLLLCCCHKAPWWKVSRGRKFISDYSSRGKAHNGRGACQQALRQVQEVQTEIMCQSQMGSRGWIGSRMKLSFQRTLPVAHSLYQGCIS